MTVETAVARLEELTTSAVSDGLDQLGIPGQCRGIASITVPPTTPVVGPAYTVRYAPVSPNSDATVGDYVDDVPVGAVVVLDNQGCTDATVWGDLLSLTADLRGIRATVIDGVCRDAMAATDLRFPIFARGRYMRTGKYRVQVVGVQEPVAIAGAQVAPDDLVMADADGVIVIPQQVQHRVIELAEQIAAREAAIRGSVRAGATLREARAVNGYFELQREEATT